ncbi:hypothetical protein GCM10023183_00170 [Nibribacter koreensis]|uniref:YD repeat-containing protein n=1 Tax=Nibribacter koreensis TaxID=1084519 RepID=A0ABP8F4J1_9BACT
MHHYTYDRSGRILKDRLVSYIYSDSTIASINYFYDGSGRLASLISEGEHKELSYKKVFRYNSLDSLAQEFRIESTADTVSILKKQFDRDGRLTSEFRRELFSANAEDAIKGVKPLYDTVIHIEEHSYRNGLPKQTVIKDEIGKTVQLYRYEHENGLLTKKMSFNMMGGDTVLASTEHYSYSKGKMHPETSTVGWQGDTIAITRRTLDGNGQLVKFVENKELDYVFVSFYEKGKIVDKIELIKQLDARMQYKYTYDRFGNLIAETRDKFPLTEKEKNAL